LRLYVIDLEETEFNEPQILHVPLTATVGELKQEIEEVCTHTESPV